jgi:hypothetical protein
LGNPGGNAYWGGGGGFSVGGALTVDGEGGGGACDTFGGGGGGCGGVVVLSVPGQEDQTITFPGAAGGNGGFLGGQGGAGDGIHGGQGGGGAGCGGAIFLLQGDLVMTQCAFNGNSAEPGRGETQDGMGNGLGKAGAIFIYQASPKFNISMLQAQQFTGNATTDAVVEDAAFDNDNWYVAQDLLAEVLGSALDQRYRAYRLQKAMGGMGGLRRHPPRAVEGRALDLLGNANGSDLLGN